MCTYFYQYTRTLVLIIHDLGTIWSYFVTWPSLLWYSWLMRYLFPCKWCCYMHHLFQNITSKEFVKFNDFEGKWSTGLQKKSRFKMAPYVSLYLKILVFLHMCWLYRILSYFRLFIMATFRKLIQAYMNEDIHE